MTPRDPTRPATTTSASTASAKNDGSPQRSDEESRQSLVKGRHGGAPPTRRINPSMMGALKRMFTEVKKDNLSDWAAVLTYRGVLCMAPAVLVLVSVLGLLGKSTTNKLLANIGQLAPGGVKTVLQQIVSSQHKGTASIAGIVGIALALYSASGYISAFMRASNAIYAVGEGRPVWKTVPVRLAVTIVMVVLIVISAVIVVFTGPIATKVGGAIGVGHTAVLVWDIAKWPVLVLIVSVMLAILYYAAPNVKQPGIKWVSPGG